jgi:F-BAR domain only protein
MQAMSTIQGNLASMAKELEDAQHNSDKLSKRAGKASAQKVENALSKLQTANQQWDSQAPFVFENLQSLDERRLNHLRDVLTQLETHEADLVERNRITVEQTLTALLEVDTAQEIRNWSQSAVAGKPITERRARQLSNAGTAMGGVNTDAASMPPPPAPRSTTDNRSEHSGKQESSGEDFYNFSQVLFVARPFIENRIAFHTCLLVANHNFQSLSSKAVLAQC